jgi:hypothetical protein
MNHDQQRLLQAQTTRLMQLVSALATEETQMTNAKVPLQNTSHDVLQPRMSSPFSLLPPRPAAVKDPGRSPAMEELVSEVRALVSQVEEATSRQGAGGNPEEMGSKMAS